MMGSANSQNTKNWSGTFCAVLLLALILHSIAYVGIYAYHALTDHTSYGGDYMALWSRAHLLAEGKGASDVYDPSQLEKFLGHKKVDDQNRLYGFGYPPPFLAMLLPFGYISFGCSLLAWLLVTGIFYVGAVFCSSSWDALKSLSPAYKRLLALFVIASPFTLYNGIVGQSSFLMAAFLIAGLNFLPRYKILSGIAFGLLSVKPQLGLMLPFLVLAQREWRCLAATLATIALLALFTTLWLGVDSWDYYLHYVPLYAKALTYHPEEMMSLNASLYQLMLTSGVNKYFSLLIQAVFFIFAGWSVWMACRKNAAAELRNSILVTATFLAAPYIMVYDMTICILPALFLLKNILQGRERNGEWLALIALLAAPMIAHTMLNFPLVFVAVLYCHCLLLKRLYAA